MSQLSFSTLWNGYETDAAAKAARDEKYRELKKSGIKSYRWVLKDQMRKYSGLNSYDGRVCDVYMLDVEN